MTDSPTFSTETIDQKRTPLHLVISLCYIALGYIVFSGLIYVFEAIGVSMGVENLGILGLAFDVVILLAAVIYLSSKGNPLAGTLGPLLALLVVVLFFAVADWAVASWFDKPPGNFWSLRNLRTVAVQTSTVAVAALGMTLIIISGGIDLSAGTVLALCATVLAYCLDLGAPIYVAIVACILIGSLAGSINGILVSCLRVVPFIITLGIMIAILGVAKIIAKETTVRPPLESIPEWLPKMVTPIPKPEWISWPLLPNFGWGVWFVMLLSVILAWLLYYSVFGRHVFALGSNESTARLCGINVPRTKIMVYALAGIFIGIAGIYQFARLKTGNPTSGLGLELKIIAAVVIGGGSLSGGRGSVVGTLTGAAIMLVIASGCTALGLKNPIQDIILGAVIIAAVTLDQFRQERFSGSSV